MLSVIFHLLINLEGDKWNILAISTTARESIVYRQGHKTAVKSQWDRTLFMCLWYEHSLSAEKLMFLTHRPVMTFRHSAISACLTSRQQTTASHQDSRQRWGAFTNGCVPYHPRCRDLVTFEASQGGGYQDCRKRNILLFSALFYQVYVSLRGNKTLYFANSQFFMPCGYAEISAKLGNHPFGLIL